MRSLKSLLMVVAALILVSCSMSAKPEKNETEKVSSAQGEVIVLNKADFLSKVYNYEKNQTQWVDVYKRQHYHLIMTTAKKKRKQ